MSSPRMQRVGQYLLAAFFFVSSLEFVPWLSRITNLALSPWMPSSAVVLAPLGYIPPIAHAGMHAVVAAAGVLFLFALVVFVGCMVALLVPREPRPFLTFAAGAFALYALLFDLPGYFPSLAITRTSNYAGFLLELAGFCLIASGRRQAIGARVFAIAYCLSVAYGLYLRVTHSFPGQDRFLAAAWEVESVLMLAAGLCVLFGYERRKAALAILAFGVGSSVNGLLQYPSYYIAYPYVNIASVLCIVAGALLVASLDPAPGPAERAG